MTQVDLSQLAVDRPAPTTQSSRRGQWVGRYAFPAVLIGGFAVLVFWCSQEFLFPPRQVQVVPVFATQAQIRTEGAELFKAAGWIEPRPTAIRVAALATGVIEELLVVEDQLVKKGEPVAELIKEDAILIHDGAVANRELAEAELERNKAACAAAKTRFEQPVHLEAKLAAADADLAKINTSLTNLPFETQRADSELKFAQGDFERMRKAAASVSEREIDRSQADFETAKAHLSELLDRKRSLEKEVFSVRQKRDAINIQLQLLVDETKEKDETLAMVDAAEAKLKQMSVAESEAQLRLQRMTIRAPVDGRVYRLVGLPGARVGSGVMTAMQGHDGSSVITMYQPESLQIRVDVRFEDIPKVSLGQSVAISNPAMREPIRGTVLFISSEADIQKNTLQVKVAIDSPPGFFKPEMLVDVTFLAPKQVVDQDASQQELSLLISENLIFSENGNSFVWVANQARGVAEKTEIELGKRGNDEMVEILSGLDIGSRLISGAVDGLENGDRIKVTGEAVSD
ncbi:efflux RND transporter periplasmic adaptor subunit [bacterium]|nr:efflux RND transporter periplasmic adaptor subunit [Mariniblastus sp.]MDA7925846.1 efflux RND transporter periplasmic adaptor subunit [Mariniblastus sp.]MDB4368846.1 efflux RND transporter periplasmic adaptor subunit [bacterium]MDB4555411.1 efflux RND transporter periplasmic adaptor subunit [bacterium]MDC3224266.1 efflux RND transporter periplasmic adaptor subunit [Mariniblastus sp.]